MRLRGLVLAGVLALGSLAVPGPWISAQGPALAAEQETSCCPLPPPLDEEPYPPTDPKLG